MILSYRTVETCVVELGEMDDLDETYRTVLLVLPERENMRMSAPDAQRLGHALFSAQGLKVRLVDG